MKKNLSKSYPQRCTNNSTQRWDIRTAHALSSIPAIQLKYIFDEAQVAFLRTTYWFRLNTIVAFTQDKIYPVLKIKTIHKHSVVNLAAQFLLSHYVLFYFQCPIDYFPYYKIGSPYFINHIPANLYLAAPTVSQDN